MINRRTLSILSKQSGSGSKARRRRLLVEGLEQRAMLATYMVNALTDIVNAGDDPGVFTLREAVLAANLSPVDDNILFAPSLTANGPATITLTTGELVLAASGGVLTIAGPGAHLLTIDGNNATRVLYVENNASANLSGLAIRNGAAHSGAGLANLGIVVLDAMAFQHNQVAVDGGAILNTGSLQVTNTTFNHNRASQSGGAISSTYDLIVSNSTFSLNSAILFGGAMNVASGRAMVSQSTIVDNTAQSTNGGTGNGGGISNFGSTTLRHSIVAGNKRLTPSVTDDLANIALDGASSSNVIGDAGSSGGLTDNINGNIVGNGGVGVKALSSIIDTTLVNNGGYTPTHALATDSVAIDAARYLAYSTEVLADSPRVYYRLDEGTGTVIDDASPNSSDASITAAGIVLDQPSLPGLNRAPRFVNGALSSSIEVPVLGTQQEMTFEAWIQPTSRPGSGDRDVIYNAQGYEQGEIHIQLGGVSGAELDVGVSGTGSGFLFGSASHFPLNQWTHVVLTYSNTTKLVEAFANGVSLGTLVFTGNHPLNLNRGNIGSWNGNSREFDGRIDEVAIYPSVLSPARIQAHYRAGFLSQRDQRGEARGRDVVGINDGNASRRDIGAFEAGRSIIDLSHLGLAGTMIFGADAGDHSGYSVHAAGDVNGDGLEDIVVGSFNAQAISNTRNGAGESYLIFGKPDWSTTPALDLANLGTAGVAIYGVEAGDNSGYSVGSADVNGDGFSDLLIGSRHADALGNAKSDAGEVYIIFGKANWSSTPFIDLASLGSAGVILYGADAGDKAGGFVGHAGDVDGDGFDDVIVGAAYADGPANNETSAGEAYVIFGKANWSATPSIDLANLGSAGVIIYGAETGDKVGLSAGTAGDLDGDGYDDLIVGGAYADGVGNGKASSGESYVIFGKADWSATPTIDLANPLGTDGVTILGAAAGDLSGFAVSTAGDANGDGFDDLIIGAINGESVSNARTAAGKCYLIFGKSDWSGTSTIDLSDPLGVSGVVFFGADGFDSSGWSVNSAGDLNADGYDDILIGAIFADSIGNTKSGAGESYVILGKANWSSTPAIDLRDLGANGITIFGVDADDWSGVSVSSAGDVNGDGFDDVLIGTQLADAAGNAKSNAGESYLIFGGNHFSYSLRAADLGTSSQNTLTGTLAANLLNGGRGNDGLVGNGGADVLIGGQGNDTLRVPNNAFARLDGGTGYDVLALASSGQVLNLRTLADNRIVDIEEIDISGSGDNTLSINPEEVLRLSRTSNTLIVRRNAGDVVNLGVGWVQEPNETIGPDSFTVFRSGAATVKVQVAGNTTITNRRVFYNRSQSSVFGNGSGTAENSIDTTKVPLLPGQTATTANYTNYFRGLNGIIVDLDNPTGLVTAADFQFATSKGITPLTFTPTAVTPTISVLPVGGTDNDARIKIEFPNGAIANAWLRITLLANANTGLIANDVFYFGNAIGDMFTGNIGSPVVVRTNASDTSAVRQNQSPSANSVPVTNIYDVNKDGRVNATDTSIVRQNGNNAIMTLFTAPVSLQVADSLFADESVSFSDHVFDEYFKRLGRKRTGG